MPETTHAFISYAHKDAIIANEASEERQSLKKRIKESAIELL